MKKLKLIKLYAVLIGLIGIACLFKAAYDFIYGGDVNVVAGLLMLFASLTIFKKQDAQNTKERRLSAFFYVFTDQMGRRLHLQCDNLLWPVRLPSFRFSFYL